MSFHLSNVFPLGSLSALGDALSVAAVMPHLRLEV